MMSAQYARTRGISLPPNTGRSYRTDANLWGRSLERGGLEDAWQEPPEDMFALTRSVAECPNEPAYVHIAFDGGVPTAINGVTMPLEELVASLRTIAAAHGVGRIDMVENRLVGIKSRKIYEAPAAVVLYAAHKELQALVTTRDTDRFSRIVSTTYADLVYSGLWFTPLRKALDAYVETLQERVTGVVRIKLWKGACRIVGRKSPFALYDHASTDDTNDVAGDGAAAGFIRIHGWPVETLARKRPPVHEPLAMSRGR